MAASYRKTLVLEPLFNSEYCKIFKRTHFEEHLRKATSENVFIKLRKIKTYNEFNFTLKKQVFSTLVSKLSENVCFHFMIGFP